MRDFKDRVQTFNPRSKQWVKIDTKNARIVGHKETPYKRCTIMGIDYSSDKEKDAN